MTRQRIWNFHNARLSLVQSCLRELIGRSTLQGAPASTWISRVESDVRGRLESSAQPVAGSGLCAGHPIMQALGNVLHLIDQGLPPDPVAAFRAASTGNRESATAIDVPTADCLSLLAQYLVAWVRKDEARLKEVESEFTGSQCDPGWLTAAAAWVGYYWDGKAPMYNPPTPATGPFALPPPGSPDGLLRVGILADWGTGEPEALAVLDQLMRQKPDLIVHLGDIYYAGTFDECRSNFLDPIKAARQKHERYIPVYSIPGNHDYYSGGRAFYAMLPQLNLGIPYAAVQEHSFFCLRNEHWQLECMDTGYNDHDLLRVADDITHLQEIEAAWHQKQLSEAGTRQIILMSHHQLFSAFMAIGRSGTSFTNQSLTNNLQGWRAAGASNIAAWLWGHEHLLEVYAVPGSGGTALPVLGRCVGYGAFPVFINNDAYKPLPSSSIPLEPAPGFTNGYVQTADDGLVYANGYAVLTLGAGSGRAEYYQVTYSGLIGDASSQLLWSEPLPPRQPNVLL